jgi:predicted acylesterase/phospholipase RssA
VKALVLSGGGLFGAWQAGAWAALAAVFQPDLIVGASVGSLNGYAIACGATPQDLRELWLREDVASLHRLEASLRILTRGRRPQVDYAVVVTDLLRLKPKIFHASAEGAARTPRPSQESIAPHSVSREFLKSAKGAARTPRPSQEPIAPHSVSRELLKGAEGAARTPRPSQEPIAPHSVSRELVGPEVTWRHLAASCAVPLVLPQVRIDGRYYSDGGLLNPLPVYAAVDLGATEILALQALPEIPSVVLKPFVLGFRAVFGFHPPLPEGVLLKVVEPGRRLGSLRDALRWRRENVERWLEQGYKDAQGYRNAVGNGPVPQKTFPL